MYTKKATVNTVSKIYFEMWEETRLVAAIFIFPMASLVFGCLGTFGDLSLLPFSDSYHSVIHIQNLWNYTGKKYCDLSCLLGLGFIQAQYSACLTSGL